MVQLSKIAKVSFVAAIFSVMKVSAYIGKASTSVLQNDAGIETGMNSKIANAPDSLESFAEHLSSHFVNHIISALQTESETESDNSAASFIQSETTFDFKEMAKTQAMNLLKEVLKTSLPPVEETVSEAVDPPHLQPVTSAVVKSGLKELFNQAENFAGVKVPDTVWKVKKVKSIEDDDEEESEEGDEEEGEEEETEEEEE